MSSKSKRKVAILGATGAVGQRYIQLLQGTLGSKLRCLLLQSGQQAKNTGMLAIGLWSQICLKRLLKCPWQTLMLSQWRRQVTLIWCFRLFQATWPVKLSLSMQRFIQFSVRQVLIEWKKMFLYSFQRLIQIILI